MSRVSWPGGLKRVNVEARARWRFARGCMIPCRTERMSLLRFCEWLASTPGSIALHESRYMFLIVLTVHVLTLSVFVGTAVMIDLRVLGRTLVRVPVSEVIERL